VILWNVRPREGRRKRSVADLSWKEAALIGLAQGIAAIPGISRLGMTMGACMLLGMDRVKAATYSLVVSIPTIAAIAAFAGLKALLGESQGAMPSGHDLGIGSAVALVTGYIAIPLLFGFSRRVGFRGFAVYCWVAAAVGIVVGLLRDSG